MLGLHGVILTLDPVHNPNPKPDPDPSDPIQYAHTVDTESLFLGAGHIFGGSVVMVLLTE